MKSKNKTPTASDTELEDLADYVADEVFLQWQKLCAPGTPYYKALDRVERLKDELQKAEAELKTEADKLRALCDSIITGLKNGKPAPVKLSGYPKLPAEKKPAAAKKPEKKPPKKSPERKVRQTWHQWLSTLRGFASRNPGITEAIENNKAFFKNQYNADRRASEALDAWNGLQIEEAQKLVAQGKSIDHMVKLPPPAGKQKKKPKVKTPAEEIDWKEFVDAVRDATGGKIELHKGPVLPRMWSFFHKAWEDEQDPGEAILGWDIEQKRQSLPDDKPVAKPPKRGLATFNQLKLPEADEVSQEEESALAGKEKVGA